MSIFNNVKAEDTVFAKLIKEIAECKSKNPDNKKIHFPEELKLKCVDYIQKTKNMNRVKFAERTSISYGTIQTWMNKYGKEDSFPFNQPLKNTPITIPNKTSPIPTSQIKSIFENMKPDKVVVRDIPTPTQPTPIPNLTPTPVPLPVQQKEAKVKETHVIVSTPDGIEIKVSLTDLPSVLKTVRG